ncbi:MAG: hypothetical protein ACLPY2_12290, partial [Bryobacteraceae bacterium]
GVTIWLAVGGWSPIHNASWQNVGKCSSNPMCSTKRAGQPYWRPSGDTAGTAVGICWLRT